MEDYIKKYNLTWKKVLKIVGIGLGGLVVIAIAVSLAGSVVRNVAPMGGLGIGSYSSKSMGLDYAPAAPAPSYGEASYDARYEESGVSLSARNVAASQATSTSGDIIIPPEPGDETVPGDDAEEYEITSYSATYETRDKAATCGTIAELKDKDYVIFESASDYDRGCSYVFKVEEENAAEILAVIEDLEPKYLSESTYTIKKQIQDFTSEEEILQDKMDSLDKTLADALAAYDEISDVATKSRNADALAKIIDSKIQLIERLASQRISISAQMERLARAKSEALDRLDYTRFSVSVYENKFVDWKQIRDSWKSAVQDFVSDLNSILQAISISLLTVIFTILQYALYILILVAVAKYGWRGIKWIWKK
jgi:hypothetical protein